MATPEIGVEHEDGKWNDSTGAYTGDGKKLTQMNLRSVIFEPEFFYFHFFVLNRFAEVSPERASGSEMDEQRKQQMAYQYLCHLEEAKLYVLNL